MGEFRFKQFTVENTDSALKVGTDSVLLGSLMESSGSRLLDIGTGTGVVALMAAQRWSDVPGLRIDAIDIDGPSAMEAAANFGNSPWKSNLSAQNCALRDFVAEGKYDHIFSNPPFFDESLRNPDPRESRARHTESLSYREVLAFASEHLSESGRVSMILPSEIETAVRRCAAGFDLNLDRVVRIRTTSKKAPRRIVVEFTRLRNILREEELTMQEGGEYTEQYRKVAGAFLLYL